MNSHLSFGLYFVLTRPASQLPKAQRSPPPPAPPPPGSAKALGYVIYAAFLSRPCAMIK